MKKIVVIITLFIICLSFASAQQSIVFGKKSKYHIVLPDNASNSQKKAATELQRYLRYIFDNNLPIVKSSDYKGKNAFIIGKMPQSDKIYNNYGENILYDGFILHTDGSNLYILGNEEKSELYGVYHFLENYLNCRCPFPNEILYPRNLDKISLSIHDIQNPSFSYRETLQIYPNISQEYADWHKIHNRKDLNKDWGMFVHTFQYLIPAEYYFDNYPEWFSEIKGKRIKDSQLCLTNENVLDELCKNLADKMTQEPNKKIWSVSQNDNENSCTCANCLQSDSLYGGPSGTMVRFVNEVARRFPDKIISTLAYLQTRKPPKNIIPEKNVNIMFCSIECQRQIPIADNPSEKGFIEDMIGWTKLTNNIFMWDYVVQFKHFLDPFPNLHVLQSNLKLFNKYHIPMIFEQGPSDLRSENSEWRTYLLAHLMWNVNIDVDSLRKIFLADYFGENRVPYIEQYFDTMTSALLKSKQILNIYGYPIDAIDGYLSPDNISFYQELFKKAYNTKPFDYLSADSQLYNDRLRLLELSLDFAILDISVRDVTPELSYFQPNSKIVKLDMQKRLENFTADCKRLGITHLNESSYTPNEFYNDITHFLKKQSSPNIAENKKITCLTKWSESYNPGAPECLVDGIIGNTDYRSRWLGFQHENLDVIIDLEEEKEIKEIGADFFFYPLSWIFAPEEVYFSYSNDCENWQIAGIVHHKNEEILTKTELVNLKIEKLNIKARYVRIFAKSILTNPAWHRGHGQPCWLFVDEIIVR